MRFEEMIRFSSCFLQSLIPKNDWRVRLAFPEPIATL